MYSAGPWQPRESKDMIRCGQLAQPARPRRRLFVAVRSAAWTVQIGRSAVIFRKNPSTFRKSTRDPESLSGYFARNSSDYFEINPQSRTDALRVFLQKNPYLFRKSTRAPQTLSPFFAKTSSDFSQINVQSNFDYIFFFPKKTFGQCTARMGAPERLVYNIIYRFAVQLQSQATKL